MSADRPDGRTLRYQHRRGELVEAVLGYLLEHGIQELSFRKLAAAAGISHVTLRHHFGTKDELLLEVFDLIRAREPVPEQIPEGGPEEVVRALWAWWTEPDNLGYLRLMFEAYGIALQRPDIYAGFLASTVPHWIDDTRQLLLAAGCPADEVDGWATLVVAQVRGLLLDILTTGDAERVAAAVDLLVNGLLRAHRDWIPNQSSPR